MVANTVNPGGERLFARLVFGAVGLIALGLGAWDVGSAVGLAPRVFGAFLAVIGLFALAGAAGARAKWAAWPAWASAVAVFAMGAIALLSELRDRANFGWADQRHVVFGAGCALIGLLMIALAWRNRPDWPPRILAGLGKPNKTPLENIKDAVELLGVTGIVLGATAFWFTNVYVPSSRLPAVNAEIKLASPDPSSIHATFLFQNQSDFRVRILSSYFNILLYDEGSGYTSKASQCTLEAQGRESSLDWLGSSAALGRQAGVVINAGRLVPDGSWLEPHEKVTFGVVSPVPPGSGPPAERVAHATADMTVARGDRIALVPEWTSASDPPLEADLPVATNSPECAFRAHLTHAGTAVWPVVEESEFNMLTRDPIEVWTDWWVGSDGRVMSFVYPVKDSVPMSTGADSTADRQHLGSKVEQLFGLVSTSTVEEVPVAAPSP
jgi:hypothetical protein